MIKTRQDYLDYLELDRKAMEEKRLKPRLLGDEIWKYQRILRKFEYYTNIKKSPFTRIYFEFVRFRYHNLGIKLGISIPPNVFDSGLCIQHSGAIYVNKDARVGKNCKLFQNTMIGTTRARGGSPTIGDNVVLAAGAKVFGGITLADNIAVGANAVVAKSFVEPNITIAGVPAKKINDKGSEGMIAAGIYL